MGKVQTTMTVLKNKEEAELVVEYTNRACQILIALPMDDGKVYLLTDSTFTVDIIDVAEKRIHSQIELAGGLVRCAIVVGEFIVLGVEDPKNENGVGNILCYDSKTLEKMGEERTEQLVTPFCFKAMKGSQIMVGLSNGCIQLFSVHKKSQKPLSVASASIDAAPQNGEIYQIIETWEQELALCSFTGLVFGKINAKQEFETSHVYFVDRVISQII